MTGLVLPHDLAERLLEHALAEVPNEACALLGGDNANRVVTSVHLTANAAASPYRFELDPVELVRIIHAMEAAGEELIAIFHSHPATAPEPSATDLREARYEVVQLIAGTAPSALGPAIRAWRFSGGGANEVPIEIRARG